MTQAAAVLVCALLGLAGALVVPRLPEPTKSGDGIQPRYHELTGTTMLLPVTVLGMTAGLAVATTPWRVWPLLVGFAGLGAALTVVDLRTTFLPQQLVRVCWWLTGLGALAVAWTSSDRTSLAARWPVAVVVTTALFWLFWRFGGLGFGDVRLAPVLALCTSFRSLDEWYLALLFTGALGVLLGLGTTWWRRRHPSRFGSAFAYGPAMWAGCWLALAWTSLSC